MRLRLPLVASLLALAALPSAASAGVDASTSDYGLPCVDLKQAMEGDALGTVSLPPCGPDARVSIEWTGDAIVIVVQVGPGDGYQLVVRTGPVKDALGLVHAERAPWGDLPLP